MEFEFDYPIVDGWYLRHPSYMYISGPSFSGKSEWILTFLRNIGTHFEVQPERIVFVHGEEQPEYFNRLREIVPNIIFINGLQEAEQSLGLSKELSTLAIFDDLFYEALNSKWFLNLSTRGYHHNNCTVMFVVQNIFIQTKFSKTISNQPKYLVLFKNVRDVNQADYLGGQVYGKRGGGHILNYMMEDATADDKFSYVLLDLHPLSDGRLKALTNIFSENSEFPFAWLVNNPFKTK